MTDNPKSKHPPLTVSVIRPPRLGQPVVPRWQRMCADYPDLDPIQTEPVLTRLPDEFLDFADEAIADLMRLLSPGKERRAIGLSVSEHENAIAVLVVAEARLATVACVTTALAAEGFFLLNVEMWGPDKAV